jgi:porphobilinogen synthase
MDQPKNHFLHSSYSSPTLRSWHSSLALKDTNLIYPLFITNTSGEKTEITSMPGNFRYGYDRISAELDNLVNRPGPSLKSVLLFGVIDDNMKDEKGVASVTNSPVPKALVALREAFGEKLTLVVDICLCAYTTHGHCGLLNPDGTINLSESLE